MDLIPQRSQILQARWIGGGLVAGGLVGLGAAMTGTLGPFGLLPGLLAMGFGGMWLWAGRLKTLPPPLEAAGAELLGAGWSRLRFRLPRGEGWLSPQTTGWRLVLPAPEAEDLGRPPQTITGKVRLELLALEPRSSVEVFEQRASFEWQDQVPDRGIALALRLVGGLARHPWADRPVPGLELVGDRLEGEVEGIEVWVEPLQQGRLVTRTLARVETGLRAARRLEGATPSGNPVVDQLIQTAGDRSALDDEELVGALLEVVHGLGGRVGPEGVELVVEGVTLASAAEHVAACARLGRSLR